jgi:hypothetical protein
MSSVGCHPARQPIVIKSEMRLAVVCVSLGACASAALAPKDSFFFPNFLFFWGSQILVVALALAFRLRPAFVAGVALSLALYISLFGAWVFSRAHPESMAWLGYMFSLPGAVIGVFSVGSWLKSRPGVGPLASGSLAAAAVAGGIAVNQTVVCGTVMYCGGK